MAAHEVIKFRANNLIFMAEKWGDDRCMTKIMSRTNIQFDRVLLVLNESYPTPDLSPEFQREEQPVSDQMLV